jgi:thiamine-phosphate pyrophosphorylase
MTRMIALPPRGLYAIADGPRPDLLAAVEAALHGGASVVQYRDKTADAVRRFVEARALVELCHRHGAPLIVNDDVELATQAGADGVHLGEDDADLARARTRLGARAIIGASCYDSLERARDLAAAGADYLAFGAFFPSPSKRTSRRATPDLLRQAVELDKPLVAIGGITTDNALPLRQAGADFLAVISAVFGMADIEGAARRFAPFFDYDDPKTR